MPHTDQTIGAALQNFTATQGQCTCDIPKVINLLVGRQCHLKAGPRCTDLNGAIDAIEKLFHHCGLVPIWLEQGYFGNCPVWHGYIVFSVSPLRSFTVWPGLCNLGFFDENQTRMKIQATIDRARPCENPDRYVDVNQIT